MLDYKAVIMQRKSEAPRPYSPKDTLTDGQLIKHQKFGVGYVINVHQPPVKVSVLFPDTTRVLVCGVRSNNEPGATGEKIQH